MTDKPFTVTMVLADNPMKGMPGQSDYTITVSSEPDFNYKPGQPLPDIETMPIPLVAAIEMIAHVAGLSYEASMLLVARGDQN